MRLVPTLMVLALLGAAGCCNCGNKPPAAATQPTASAPAASAAPTSAPSLSSIVAAMNAQNRLHHVIVVDPAGNPVPGAAVSPVTASMNGQATLTDANGEAFVPPTIGYVQGTEWVSISKRGFNGVQVAVPDQWPLRVALSVASAVTSATQQ
jgi:hypothetical protein